MASKVIAEMSAKLGLDPAEFLEKMKGVQGVNAFTSAAMAREWKKTGRDGQEGLRLIDEALGIHVARPVARIIAETFPALSKALSSVLSGVAGGAFGIAIFEFADHIAKKMDEAKKKEEEYRDAVQKTAMVSAEAGAESEKRLDGILAKQAALRGDKGGEAHFKDLIADAENVQRMADYVEKLNQAELREARAAQERSTFWATIGEWWHKIFTTDASLNIEKTTNALEEFDKKFARLSAEDRLNHTTTAAKALETEFKNVNRELGEMQIRAEQSKVPAWLQNAGKSALNWIGAPGLGDAIPHAPTEAEMENKRGVLKTLQGDKDQGARDAKEDVERKILDAMEKAKDTAAAHKRELQSEFDAIEHVADASKASASAAILLADATAKGTAASIQATASAEAEKKILELTAELKLKSAKNQNTPAENKELADNLAAQSVEIRHAALRQQVAVATENLSRRVAEYNSQSKALMSTLEAEATGQKKVSREQQDQLNRLNDLRTSLAQLKIAYDTLPAGPNKARLGADIAAQQSAIDAAAAQTTGVVNPKIESAGFEQEAKKIREGLNAVADPTPWEKTEARVKELKAEFPDLAAEVNKLGVEMHAAGAAGELEKMAEKVKEAQASSAAFASLSPFAKIEAEVTKAKDAYNLLPDAVNAYRRALIALHATENESKAFEAVENLSATGSKVGDLHAQYAALARMQSSGQTDDGRQLNASELAAVNLEMREITDEIDKIAVKTGDVNSGFKAWLDNLQNVQSNGQMVLSMMDAITKGAEDNAAKSIVDIIEKYRNGHHALIKELKAMWEHYFAELTEMAIKNAMTKGMASLIGAVRPAPTQPAGIPGLADGPPLVGGKIADAAGGGGLTAAGTSLQAAAAQLTAAAAALRASAGGGGGGLGGLIPGAGGGAGGGGLVGGDGDIGWFAEGGDTSPGSSFISGESGAERVDMDKRGGAHITPLGFSTKSGGDVHYYDQRGSVVTDDLVRKADAARAMSASENRSVARAVSMSQDIARRGGAAPAAR
jgi:hypothetical protein